MIVRFFRYSLGHQARVLLGPVDAVDQDGEQGQVVFELGSRIFRGGRNSPAGRTSPARPHHVVLAEHDLDQVQVVAGKIVDHLDQGLGRQDLVRQQVEDLLGAARHVAVAGEADHQRAQFRGEAVLVDLGADGRDGGLGLLQRVVLVGLADPGEGAVARRGPAASGRSRAGCRACRPARRSGRRRSGAGSFR